MIHQKKHPILQRSRPDAPNPPGCRYPRGSNRFKPNSHADLPIRPTPRPADLPSPSHRHQRRLPAHLRRHPQKLGRRPAVLARRNHILIGEVTPNNLLKQNSFLIWRGGTPKDFELKVDFRISDHGNSGINYRSAEIPGTKWLLRGYQADIDGADKYTGQNYEERGRTFLAMRGQVTHVDATGPTVIASLGSSDDLKAFIHPNDWNQYHLIVRGNLLIHILNGHIMSEVIDDDTANRKFEGLIGVQVHVGLPMKIEYRTILLKPIA